MNNSARYAQYLLPLYEELLAEDDLETALSRSLETLVRALKCEAGAI